MSPATILSRFWTLRIPARLALQGRTMVGYTFTDPLTYAEAQAYIQSSIGLDAAKWAHCRLFPSLC